MHMYMFADTREDRMENITWTIWTTPRCVFTT